MLREGYFTFMGVGGLFVVLGIGAIIWGTLEESSYNKSLISRPDLREFLEHLPKWPQPGALKIGGWISIAIGLVLLVTGAVNWYLR